MVIYMPQKSPKVNPKLLKRLASERVQFKQKIESVSDLEPRLKNAAKFAAEGKTDSAMKLINEIVSDPNVPQEARLTIRKTLLNEFKRGRSLKSIIAAILVLSIGLGLIGHNKIATSTPTSRITTSHIALEPFSKDPLLVAYETRLRPYLISGSEDAARYSESKAVFNRSIEQLLQNIDEMQRPYFSAGLKEVIERNPNFDIVFIELVRELKGESTETLSEVFKLLANPECKRPVVEKLLHLFNQQFIEHYSIRNIVFNLNRILSNPVTRNHFQQIEPWLSLTGFQNFVKSLANRNFSYRIIQEFITADDFHKEEEYFRGLVTRSAADKEIAILNERLRLLINIGSVHNLEIRNLIESLLIRLRPEINLYLSNAYSGLERPLTSKLTRHTLYFYERLGNAVDRGAINPESAIELLQIPQLVLNACVKHNKLTTHLGRSLDAQTGVIAFPRSFRGRVSGDSFLANPRNFTWQTYFFPEKILEKLGDIMNPEVPGQRDQTIFDFARTLRDSERLTTRQFESFYFEGLGIFQTTKYRQDPTKRRQSSVQE